MSSRMGDHEDQVRDEGDGASYRPSTMQTFGPKNSFDDSFWMEKYQRKPLIRKVIDNKTWTQDETLKCCRIRLC